MKRWLQLLRRTGKPVLLAANKVDSATREPSMGDVFRLGFGQVFAVSATHGRGVGDLLDATVGAYVGRPRRRGPLRTRPEPRGSGGRKRAHPPGLCWQAQRRQVLPGQSSAGEERVLVHDSQAPHVTHRHTLPAGRGRIFVLVDHSRPATPPRYRHPDRGRIREDGARPIGVRRRRGPGHRRPGRATAEDARLANFIEESGRAALIVVNKVTSSAGRD